MHWLEIAAIAFGLLGFAAMGAVLAYRLYRNPLLLAGLVPVVIAHVKPVVVKYIIPYFLRRNSPEIEARMHECIRRGGRWDNFRKKCMENK